jgi:hypothetical protein
VADVVLHVAVALAQPVHVKLAGALLQVAVSVSALPTLGVVSDADTTHAGTLATPSDGAHIATGIGPVP